MRQVNQTLPGSVCTFKEFCVFRHDNIRVVVLILVVAAGKGHNDGSLRWDSIANRRLPVPVIG